MFIASKKNIKVSRGDGSSYLIKKGFIGEIPKDVAEHWLVKNAIKSGSIVTSESSKDSAMEKAEGEAKKRATRSDIRPDVDKTGANKE